MLGVGRGRKAAVGSLLSRSLVGEDGLSTRWLTEPAVGICSLLAGGGELTRSTRRRLLRRLERLGDCLGECLCEDCEWLDMAGKHGDFSAAPAGEERQL